MTKIQSTLTAEPYDEITAEVVTLDGGRKVYLTFDAGEGFVFEVEHATLDTVREFRDRLSGFILQCDMDRLG